MEHDSRYHTIKKAEFEFSDGREVTYRRRRFLPGADTMTTLTRVTVEGGDRLDLITAASLGDSEQFWRVCDANDVMDPNELEIVGQRVRVPIPKV
ncbi:MAG: hypothetical protein O7C01_03310 [Actinobacteria bacterium]|nr:hypothetical protein [Actinomycetota bacterium]